jgi:prephenate dehydrogenase
LIGKVVGILGVGTIGGSIGMRARRNGAYVLGSDCSAAALDAARDSGAIDAIAVPDSLPYAADVVVIATHLEATLSELARLASQAKVSRALLLDVSSVKAPVVRAARGLRNFVGTHPMAGSERSGANGARTDLFEGCSWAYVPSGSDELDGRAVEFIRSCGAAPIAIEAEEHDRCVALTSHLPQIVASCYAALLRQNGPDSQLLCGPVARELLRIANMNPAMWGDILRANAHNVEPQLRRLTAELHDALSR